MQALTALTRSGEINSDNFENPNEEIEMKVQDIMTRNVKSCRPETNLAEAASILWETDCGSLPVVDDSGQAVGMITDRDIAIAVSTKGRCASEISVGEVLSGRLFSTGLDDDVSSAMRTMQENRVRRLPVVNAKGKLQGILCLNDIVLRAETAKGRSAPDISYDDAMNTLKAICEHRPLQTAARA
jgi:CBS domain-containing protein